MIQSTFLCCLFWGHSNRRISGIKVASFLTNNKSSQIDSSASLSTSLCSPVQESSIALIMIPPLERMLWEAYPCNILAVLYGCLPLNRRVQNAGSLRNSMNVSRRSAAIPLKPFVTFFASSMSVEYFSGRLFQRTQPASRPRRTLSLVSNKNATWLRSTIPWRSASHATSTFRWIFGGILLHSLIRQFWARSATKTTSGLFLASSGKCSQDTFILISFLFLSYLMADRIIRTSHLRWSGRLRYPPWFLDKWLLMIASRTSPSSNHPSGTGYVCDLKNSFAIIISVFRNRFFLLLSHWVSANSTHRFLNVFVSLMFSDSLSKCSFCRAVCSFS